MVRPNFRCCAASYLYDFGNLLYSYQPTLTWSRQSQNPDLDGVVGFVLDRFSASLSIASGSGKLTRFVWGGWD